MLGRSREAGLTVLVQTTVYLKYLTCVLEGSSICRGSVDEEDNGLETYVTRYPGCYKRSELALFYGCIACS